MFISFIYSDVCHLVYIIIYYNVDMFQDNNSRFELSGTQYIFCNLLIAFTHVLGL